MHNYLRKVSIMEGDNSLYNNIILRINDIMYPMSLATYNNYSDLTVPPSSYIQ